MPRTNSTIATRAGVGGLEAYFAGLSDKPMISPAQFDDLVKLVVEPIGGRQQSLRDAVTLGNHWRTLSCNTRNVHKLQVGEPR